MNDATQAAQKAAELAQHKFEAGLTDFVMDLLTRLNRDQGVTIVMVTHEHDMAAYGKRIVHFLDGLVESDDPNGGRN